MKLRQRIAEAMLANALTRLDLTDFDDLSKKLECVFGLLTADNKEKLAAHEAYRRKLLALKVSLSQEDNRTAAGILVKQCLNDTLKSLPAGDTQLSTDEVDAITYLAIYDVGCDIEEQYIPFVAYASDTMKQILFRSIFEGRVSVPVDLMDAFVQTLVGRQLEPLEVDEYILQYSQYFPQYLPTDFVPWLALCSQAFINNMAEEALDLDIERIAQFVKDISNI